MHPALQNCTIDNNGRACYSGKMCICRYCVGIWGQMGSSLTWDEYMVVPFGLVTLIGLVVGRMFCRQVMLFP